MLQSLPNSLNEWKVFIHLVEGCCSTCGRLDGFWKRENLILCFTMRELGDEGGREKGSLVSYKTNCNLLIENSEILLISTQPRGCRLGQTT